MKKILIIEDNQNVRENIAEILELDGYTCFQAENGKVGVRQAMEHAPDLIICDVMMPELDGFGVLKILSKNENLMHIPFMFLTAKADTGDFRKGMGLGADDYITKPFDDVELLESIEMRLRKSSLQYTNRQAATEQTNHFYNESKATEDFKELLIDKEIRKYNKKDIVYEVGQYPRWIYVIIDGEAISFQVNDFGKELIIDFFKSGDVIGFFPVFNDLKYLENVRVTENTQIALIPIEQFKSFVFDNKNYTIKFLKEVVREAYYSHNQLIEFAYSSVRKKVANAILKLEKKNNSDSFSFNRNNLASYSGIAKETLIRTLSDFKSEKLIEINDNELHILDQISLLNMPQ